MIVECTHCGKFLCDGCDEPVHVDTEPYCDANCVTNEHRNRFVNAQEEQREAEREARESYVSP
jgi:hypothetical protein